MENLLCAVPCDKPLRFMILFNAHNNFMRLVLLLSPDRETETFYVTEKEFKRLLLNPASSCPACPIIGRLDYYFSIPW